MKRTYLLLLITILFSKQAIAGDLWLFGEENDGLKKLGCLSCSKHNTDSIFNEYGNYGNKYSSSSVWNKYGWGSKYKSESPCNTYSQNAPIIMDSDTRQKLGRFSLNKFGAESVCASSGVPKVCDMVKFICAED